MTEIVGGLRARLVRDSLFGVVESGLQDLGWFDSGRAHLPLRLIPKPLLWDEIVAYNTIALANDIAEVEDMELGSGLMRDTVAYVFDFYAENDSVAVAVSADIRDLLRGRLDVGPARPVFDILDYRQATPEKVGYAVVDEVRIERPATLAGKEWLRHWLQIRCVVQDTYTDDSVEELDELVDAIYSEAGSALLSEAGAAIVGET